MTNPYTDLDRPPLRERALRRALVVPGALWTDVRVVARTESTNADVAAAARAGAPEGLVVTAESQVAGRGRLGRQWVLPPRAGIAVSALLRPGDVPVARYGWLPLLAGVALVTAVRRIAEVDAVLKWPNDLLVGGSKCGGVLVEAVVEPAVKRPGSGGTAASGCSAAEPAVKRPDSAGTAASGCSAAQPAVVVGIGLNTTLRAAELPVPTATSLALAGAATVDRDPLLRAVLRELADWYGRFRDAAGDPDACDLRETYLLHCATVGREVRVELPGGTSVTGTAQAIDTDGRVIVDGCAYAAGDVVHLR